MKRAIIVHGWGGSSREPLLQWIAGELKAKGYQVSLPDMPDSDYPQIEVWVNKLKEVKDKANEFIAIFSDNDPLVLLDTNKQKFEQGLGAKIIIEEGKGHFSKEDGVKELPVLKELI